ncbi:MAG TPA: AbrB/MazE/SpoVT family DNA-binding domain-containing protein [Bryobacteraceae bacterium]|nr:AbrB/MazE/SpoVT family DNA-binding domain-containing protein [Bryobacteraceae bacterium]
MSIVTVKNKYQVVIPQRIREQIGVNIGDVFEVRAERGKVVMQPKAIVDRDEYTPAQRRRIDAQLAKSIKEHKGGRSYGPFNTADEMIAFLHQQLKAKPPRTVKKATKHRSK